MKEATGELNVTLVVLMVVGLLMTFFYFTLWPMIKSSFEAKSQCSKAICDASTLKDGYVTCHTKDNKGNTFKCVYKG